MRQICLDTETTGISPAQGHRLIEIGCVEMVNRRLTGKTFHVYLKPDMEIEAGAFAVHGISNAFLQDKPRFEEVWESFFDFIKSAELIIHNAPFDLGFLDTELRRIKGDFGGVDKHCSVIDTLVMARKLHPGQKNNLDALCKRYNVDNSKRDLHGALIDAKILSQVYLAMTSGQESIFEDAGHQMADTTIRRVSRKRPPLRVIHASELEAELDKLYRKKLASKKKEK